MLDQPITNFQCIFSSEKSFLNIIFFCFQQELFAQTCATMFPHPMFTLVPNQCHSVDIRCDLNCYNISNGAYTRPRPSQRRNTIFLCAFVRSNFLKRSESCIAILCNGIKIGTPLLAWNICLLSAEGENLNVEWVLICVSAKWFKFKFREGADIEI